MWQRVAIFTWVALVFIVGGFYWYSSTSEAVDKVMRPVSDGVTLEWASTSRDHYTTVDDAVIQPAAGDSTDYISVPNRIGIGDEREELSFGVVADSGLISRIVVWIYGQNTGCKDLPVVDNCDELLLTLLGKSVAGVGLNVGSYGWTRVVFDYTKNKPANSNLDLTIKRIKRGLKGELRIAAIYMDVTYAAENRAGQSANDNGLRERAASAPAIHTSTDTRGNNIKELIQRTLNAPPQHTSTNYGGG